MTTGEKHDRKNGNHGHRVSARCHPHHSPPVPQTQGVVTARELFIKVHPIEGQVKEVMLRGPIDCFVLFR